MSADASPDPSGDSSREPPAESLVGRVLGDRYRLEALIGRGSMGAVYRASHMQLDRAMAVKVLRPALVGDEPAALRFDREAQAVSRLDHEHCVQVVDYGTTSDDLKYLVMQLLDGPSLRELMDRPMAPNRAVDLVEQILRGLQHAHRKGLVHRDLKPDNIIIVRSDDGREMAKLVDFGLVQLAHGTATQRRLTSAGFVFGTPLYMSPEQAIGGPVDPRTDLYAAGVILHQLLAGEPPFAHDDPVELAAMHVTRAPPALPAHVPAGLRAVVTRLLAKRGHDRFSSAGAAATALRRAVPATRSPAPRTTAPYSDPHAIIRALSPTPRGADVPRLGHVPTLRPMVVESPPARAPKAARGRRNTTQVDNSLPTLTHDAEDPAPIPPQLTRGLFIAPMSALVRAEGSVRDVDHRTVVPAPPNARMGAGRWVLVVVLALLGAIVWALARA